MHLKKPIFRLILILIPFLFLLLIELILRLTDYGDDLSVVAVVERGGEQYYTMNQLAGKRYFDKNRLYYRKGSHDFFQVEKQLNTLRVFCFGESTTAGFPYEYNAVPAEFLRTWLINALPGKNIEVINTAIAATNSYTVSEFASELAKYQPDLYVIYMGQNEFYGAFGVASTISIGKNRQIIKTYLWLQQFKTFLLLKDFIASVSSLFKKSGEGEEKLLMEQMAADNSIKLNSDDYNTAKETFKKNYEEIIKTAEQNNIPILISTLVTNEKDLPPFVSIYSENLNHEQKKERQNFYSMGIKAKQGNDLNAAAEYFRRALSVDSMPANIHYELAECYDKLGNQEKAEKEFITAKDLDGLRFRAPSDFNLIIKNLAQNYKIPLADEDKAFRRNSPEGIIGSNLLIDHVHPNIKGYFLLAKTWFSSIKENNLLGLSKNVSLNDTLLWNESNITELDSIIGELKILKLKNEPPFSKVKKEFDFNPGNSIVEVAYRYVIEQQMSWASAHLEAAKVYEKINEPEKALKEYDAILIADENNPFIIKLKGDTYYNLKIFSKAEEYYMEAFQVSEDPSIGYKLGLTSLILKKPNTAVRFLNNCLLPGNIGRFNPDEIEEIRYKLALAYSDIKMPAYAVRELNRILETNPSNKEAQNFLNKIESSLNSR